MKAVIFSAILFTILIILIVANSIYIHKVCDTMLNLLSSLEPSDVNGVEELCSIWKRHRTLFSVSVHDSRVERIDELTEKLKSAAAKSDGAEFEENVTLLSQALEELKEFEELSFEGIV